MKRIPIAELEGVALDWAVDRADGGAAEVSRGGAIGYWYRDVHDHGVTHRFEAFHPSADWSQCGPLIERYKVGIEYSSDDIYAYSHFRPLSVFVGRSLLPLACRAIVAAHNPDGFVEVPDELAPSYKTTTQHPVDS